MMIQRKGRIGWIALVVLLWGAAGMASAARVRFHYVAPDPCRPAEYQPLGPCGGGERVTWRGIVADPGRTPPPPNQMVTFVHAYTGRNVIVPLNLPLDSTPRIEHRRDYYIYNYGSYTVEVHFLPDGSLDVIYNSGLFRAL